VNNPNHRHIVYACNDCAMLVGLNRPPIDGVTSHLGTCELCDHKKPVSSYRTGVTAADIRDDMR